MTRFLTALALSATLALPLLAPRAEAASAVDVARLLDALDMDQTLEIMRLEGLAYGGEIAEDMLPGGAGPAWTDTLEGIYDAEFMMNAVRTAFTDQIGDRDVGPLIDFLESELGRRVVALEISARRAQLDEDVEEAATEAYLRMEEEDHPRVGAIGDYIETNQLVDLNVVGAMNSNLKFYNGLLESNPEALGLTTDEALRNVWAQEADIRDSTTEWLYSFLLMAYQPLSEEELDELTRLSATDEGKFLNALLFAGFDPMFSEISLMLGRAVGKAMEGQEL